MFCQNCGAKIVDDAAFCGECGTPTNKKSTSPSSQEVKTNPTPVNPAPPPQTPVSSHPTPPPPPAGGRPLPTGPSGSSGSDFRDQPMTVGGWMGTMLIMVIPFVVLITFILITGMGTMLIMVIPFINVIMMFVWAFGSRTNRSKKTFFQAVLLFALIGFILNILIFVFFGSIFSQLFNQVQYMY